MTLISEDTPMPRDLENEQAPKLVLIPGIVIATPGVKVRTIGMKGYDHGVSFPDNLPESMGDGHKLVAMVYVGDIGT